MEGNILDYNEERIGAVDAEIEDASLRAGKARQAGDLETWRFWRSKMMLLFPQKHRLMEERIAYLQEHLPSASASYTVKDSGPQPAEPKLQRLWNQLAATETLSSFDSTLILDLGSNTHFPHEGSDVQGRLLVRQCYEDLSQMVHDRFAEQLQGLVFIIIGTPGIGKTYFLYFLMWQLARSGKTVVWDKRDAETAFMFSPLGVFQGPLWAFKANFNNPDTWYLVDGKTPLRWCAKTVLVTSPDYSIYKDAHKRPNASMRYMGPWSCKEISAARTHIFKDQHVADVKGRFSKWGGIPRFVLPNTDEESQALLKEAIDTFNIGNLTHIMIMPDMKSSEQAFDIGHKIVHLTVDANNLHGPVVFASDWVREELVRRFSHLKQREERKFLEDGWGNQVPEVFAFGKALRERYAKVIRPSTL